MKRLFLALALLCFLQGKAQDYKVGRIEGEVGAGFTFGADKLNFDKNRIGATFYAEGRYNLRQFPIDVGIQVAGSIFYRESNHAGDLKFKTWNVLAVSDYNVVLGRKVSFFAGIGLGYASLGNSAPITFDDSQTNWAGFSTGDKTGSFCFMPRVGIELFHHLRLTFDYRLQEKANRHFGISLGVVFGGGAR